MYSCTGAVAAAPRRAIIRSFASGGAGRLGKNVLSLDHFIQRQRVLAFWRQILREVNKIPASGTRDEMRGHARAEFERYRHVSDLAHIRYLLSTGKTEFDTMKRYIDEQAR